MSEVGGVRQRGATLCPRPGAAAGRSHPASEARGAARRSYLASEARGGGREEPHHIQGVVAARAQEDLEELSHTEGHEEWR